MIMYRMYRRYLTPDLPSDKIETIEAAGVKTQTNRRDFKCKIVNTCHTLRINKIQTLNGHIEENILIRFASFNLSRLARIKYKGKQMIDLLFSLKSSLLSK